jgi:putative PIG3 family NAD(P)H quinone oxidoreductase
MHAIVIEKPGKPDVMRWNDVPDPEVGPGEVLLDIVAAGINRADTAQRMGAYPPPPGAPEYPGLEASGRIAALGEGVTGWSVGDEVCALLSGGGYAERVAVPAGQLLPVPKGVSMVEAAGLPEVACTVYNNVFMLAGLREGESFLVLGGSSGIGTMAIQLAKAHGARVLCTAGTEEKLARCRELGADIAINYRQDDFVKAAAPVDVILDNMGAKYLARNVATLGPDGRLMIIGFQGGAKAELNLVDLMTRRASIQVTGLRARPGEQKAEIVAAVRKNVWPLLESGQVRSIVDRTVPVQDAATAHRILEESTHVGKIILTVRD